VGAAGNAVRESQHLDTSPHQSPTVREAVIPGGFSAPSVLK
jgi:hypothetical protein